MKRLLPLLAVPAFLVAGCSAGNGTTTTNSPGPAATSAAAPAPGDTTATGGIQGDSSGQGSSGQGSGGQGSSGQSGSGQSAGTPRCHTADLSLTLGASDGAAGTYHQNLIFTNKSGHKCTLYGYPGVSWVAGDQGTQVNDPFQRTSGPEKTITLAARGQAHAVLVTHAAGNFPADKCKPVAVRGYRIYPPDETAAVFVSLPGTECSARGVNLGQVLPIKSGPGVQGE